MSADPGGVPSPPAGGEPPKSRRPDPPMAGGQLVHHRDFIEFMGSLESVLRASAEPVERRAGLSRAVKLVIAAVLVLMLALGKGTLWSWWLNYSPVPNELVGAWGTTADRFEDRGFVITRDSLQLRVGGGQSVTYAIVGVRRGRIDGNLFTFDYRDAQTDLQLGLRIKSDSIVQIENLPGIVWTKESR